MAQKCEPTHRQKISDGLALRDKHHEYHYNLATITEDITQNLKDDENSIRVTVHGLHHSDNLSAENEKHGQKHE